VCGTQDQTKKGIYKKASLKMPFFLESHIKVQEGQVKIRDGILIDDSVDHTFDGKNEYGRVVADLQDLFFLKYL